MQPNKKFKYVEDSTILRLYRLMNIRDFGILELLIIMELSRHPFPEIKLSDLENLIEYARMRLGKYEFLDLSKTVTLTSDTYIDTLIKRNLLEFETEFDRYSIQESCLILGQALYEISTEFIGSANFEYFSNLIIRIDTVLEEWLQLVQKIDQTEITTSFLSEVIESITKGKTEIENYHKLMIIITKLYNHLNKQINNIKNESSSFKAEFIKNLNQDTPLKDLQNEVDQFIQVSETSFKKLSSINNELNEVIKANKHRIINIQNQTDDITFYLNHIIRFLLDNKESEKEDISFFRDKLLISITFLEGLSKFFATINWRISHLNQRKLNSLLNLLKSLNSLFKSDQLIGEFYAIWNQGVNSLKGNREKYFDILVYVHKRRNILQTIRRQNIEGKYIEEFTLDTSKITTDLLDKLEIEERNNAIREKYQKLKSIYMDHTKWEEMERKISDRFLDELKKTKGEVNPPMILRDYLKKSRLVEYNNPKTFSKIISSIYQKLEGLYILAQEKPLWEIEPYLIEFPNGTNLRIRSRSIIISGKKSVK